MRLASDQQTKRRIPKWTLSERLVKSREEAGIRDRETMALRMGVHVNTIGNYERGDTTPMRATVERWAEVTDTDVDWLVGDAFDERGRRRVVTAGYHQLDFDDLEAALLVAELRWSAPEDRAPLRLLPTGTC
jgi:transcriptional regulator with XRE-family HTH domain